MRVKTLLIIVLIMPAVILAGLYVRELYLVDACIDSGGSFNYETMTCNHAVLHPYVPFLARYRAFPLIVAIFACLALLVAWLGRSQSSGKKRKHRG